MKICIINFSGRRDGNCHDIAEFIEQTLTVKHEIALFEICDLNITPCGKCDYECFYKDKICPYTDDDINRIFNALCAADLAYYILPNYINYPNAYFFMFCERKQGFFAQKRKLAGKYLSVEKRFIVVSNTEQDNFKKILSGHVSEDISAEFLFLATRDFDKGSPRGGIMESEQAKTMVRGFLA